MQNKATLTNHKIYWLQEARKSTLHCVKQCNGPSQITTSRFISQGRASHSKFLFPEARELLTKQAESSNSRSV